MLKNKKFKFEDDLFTTGFIVLATVGWFSLALMPNSENIPNQIVESASLAPVAQNVFSSENSKMAAKDSKVEKAKNVVVASEKPVKQISERVLQDLKSLTDKINEKAGSVVVYYDDSGPIEKLHLNLSYLLLTDKRPRVSAANSKVVGPAIHDFSAGKKVVAYIDHEATTPESYITAVEKYMISYRNLKVERRALTTVQNQLELTLEVQ